ncbi:hypothetical protein BDV96DRAFT_636736 [Lophiotrema nucula]|uniref:NACHT domain-containing protein n=1 Tax=Lophiotrema nucula TaxID=690887 RepID=A0A6A5YNZ7_9PLEO|nr:hypothetical protein BDV96DRAFT_636736 [Lophiotrema nucula]
MSAQPGACHFAGTSLATPSPACPQLTPDAKRTFEAAFHKLERVVRTTSIDDYHEFRATSLRDVREAARAIERQMAARQCLRNLRRLDIFLGGLERYSKAIEVLCNGTPYLPWIWAPIKLTIQIASDYLSAFETLITAYSSIAECLPRFDRLGDALKSEPAFQNILATYYSDILEFHHRAYIYVKRPAWKLFFRSCWGRFDARFKSTLESLSRHARLVDNEAHAWDILKSQEWRQTSKERAEKEDAERAEGHLLSSLSWLENGMDSHDHRDTQENILSEHLCHRHTGSHEWIVRKDKFRAWHNTKRGQTILWLKGKPGSGKTILSASITQFLRQSNQSVVLFYFCSYASIGNNPSARILKSLASQVLRQKPELSSYVNAEYVTKGLAPSLQTLRELLPHLLSALNSTSIIIDGVDECHEVHHKDIVRELLSLTSEQVGGNVRLWVASRDTRFIQDLLHKKQAISLSEERDSVGTAINKFVGSRIAAMQSRFQDLDVGDVVVSNITKQIVEKAEGMFLWVRLVLDTLEDEVFSIHDLKAAVQVLPTSLEDFYERILVRVTSPHKPNRDKALQILQWVAFARRPVRSCEILNAIAFTTDRSTINQDTMLSKAVLKLCSPLIEQHADGVIQFVHFTVREFLVASTSSRPILELAISEYALCLSCISYLAFSAPILVNTNMISGAEEVTPAYTVMIDIAKGMHSLHLYAQEYWIEHLLSYLDACSAMSQRLHMEQVLFARLDVLVQLFSATQAIQSVASSSRNSIVAQGQRTMFLQSHPGLTAIVVHRRNHLAQQESDGTTIHDRSIFGDMLRAYHSNMAFLLGSHDFSGLSEEELRLFQETYGPTAITCRFSGCVYATLGFSSESLRNQHERSHRPKIFCSIPGCTYGLAFSSARALKNHQRECHSETEENFPIGVTLSRFSPTATSINSRPNRIRSSATATNATQPSIAISDWDGGSETIDVLAKQPCIDASEDKKFLAKSHLRRLHFHPRKRGRKGKNDTQRGAAGRDDPPMDYPKANWIKEIEVEKTDTFGVFTRGI